MLDTKMRLKPMHFSLKVDLIERFLDAINRFLILLHRRTKLSQLALRIAPPFFCTQRKCSLTLLSFLLALASKGKSTLGSLLSFLFCFLAHSTPS
jgi:hypothetical protein